MAPTTPAVPPGGTATPSADEARLRATYPSMFQPEPTVGTVLERMYPSMVAPEQAPREDPGDDPGAVRTEFLRLLDGGREDLILEFVQQDPEKMERFFEKIGLADNHRLRAMLRGARAYPSMRNMR